MNPILQTRTFKIYVAITKSINLSNDKAEIYEKIVFLNPKLKCISKLEVRVAK